MNRANSSGNTLEKAVMAGLSSKGFEVVSYREWIKNPDSYGKELLLRNVPFTTIYNHGGNTEFLLKSEKHGISVRIECKWQQSGGSVDEKFAYLYLNAVQAMPEDHIIIIVGGGGYKAGALQWLKDAADNKTAIKHQKNIKIFSLEDFMIWTNKTF